MQRTYFTISTPADIQNIVKGIYSNKSKLFQAIQDCIKDYNFTDVQFVNVFNYDQAKKVNYNNITSLLRVLLVNESFAISLSNAERTIVLEITKLSMNSGKIFLKK